MAFRTTRRADQDIIDIYAHGAETFGEAQAERYHAALVGMFGMLARNPQLARERSEFRPPIRLHPFGAHMIAYVVRGDEILILRVLHGRQDWERHL